MQPEHDLFCFTWSPLNNKTDGTTRAALSRQARWPVGQNIEISFLDGDPVLQARVAEAARLWIAPGHANLRFGFRRDTTQTPIRISFSHRGSWSLLGMSCLTVKDQAQPTMNFGWLTPSSSDDEIRGVVLHEFGHALGLIHEHQSPVSNIQWNTDEIYRDLAGPPHYWTKELIDRNIFTAHLSGETNFTKFDRQSIMIYPFPSRWTLNGFSSVLNNELSDLDKRFIRAQYP